MMKEHTSKNIMFYIAKMFYQRMLNRWFAIIHSLFIKTQMEVLLPVETETSISTCT